MSLLTDLFVSSVDDAARYEMLSDAGDLPPQRFERLQFTGLTSLEFEALWALARNEEWDPARHALTVLDESDDGHTWLCQFPDAFVALLARLDAPARKGLAEKWALAEEVTSEEQELTAVLEGLSELAGKAKAARRGLFLWGSM